MFQVVWLQKALDELATMWTKADSALRQAITSAAHIIDQTLQFQPETHGESRPGGERVFFVHPLGITFTIFPDHDMVVIVHVWDIRRNK